jgi:hypothetical protein
MICIVWICLVIVLIALCGCTQSKSKEFYGDGPNLPYLESKKTNPFLPLIGQPLDQVYLDVQERTQPSQNVGSLQKVAEAVADAAAKASTPVPPVFDTVPELGPQRVWTPTYPGLNPTFTDNECIFYRPNPRLYATNLDQLKAQRSLVNNIVNMVEPQRLRQSYLQFLTYDYRSKKDPYTRASATNDIAHSTCVELSSEIPKSVNF